MKNQLKVFDYLDILMQEHQKQRDIENLKLNYFVSDIMSRLNIEDKNEINISLNRTFDACTTLHISKHKNFKKIYRFDGENIHIDWKISSLACYLIIINCNPNNKNVAVAQVQYLYK